MTDRLAEIEARLKAATPGPWVYPVRFETTGGLDHRGGAIACPMNEAGRVFSHRILLEFNQYYPSKHDAALIANAPSDIAWLIAELRLARLAAMVAGSATARMHDELQGSAVHSAQPAEVTDLKNELRRASESWERTAQGWCDMAKKAETRYAELRRLLFEDFEVVERVRCLAPDDLDAEVDLSISRRLSTGQRAPDA